MSQNDIMAMARDALGIMLLVGGPLLAGSLIVGLVIGLFQAMTQIQEQTLTFIPKILAIVVILLVMGPWMLNVMMSYTTNLLHDVTIYARQ